MPMRCKVCGHREVDAINAIMVDGRTANRIIAKRFRLTLSSVTRHRKAHLPKAMLAAKDAASRQKARDLLGSAERLMREVERMLEACLRELEVNGQIELGARAEEVRIRWTRLEKDKPPESRTSTLAELFRILAGERVLVSTWSWKHADPRELILKTIERGDRLLRLLGELAGELKAEQINLVLASSPEWGKVLDLIQEALRPHPAALQQVYAGLADLEVEVHGQN